MRLNQLEYVVEVAKYNSFSKASKKLFVAQPTLSIAISALEEELGVTIFNRTPKGAFLTEKGALVLTQAEHILASVEQMNIIVDKKDSHFTVSIAAVPAAGNGLTTNLLKMLSVSHPEIQFSITERRPTQILSTLIDGLADIVIGSYPEDRQKNFLDEAYKNNIHIEPIFTDYLYAFVGCNHPLANQEYVFLCDFEQERQAIFRDYLFLEEEISPNCYLFSDRSGIKQAVAAELAYAVFPHQMVLDDIYIKSGSIKAIPLADNNTKVITYLAWRKSTYTPKQVNIVLDAIRELYAETAERLAKLTTFKHDENVECCITRY